jgi:ribosomal subunit interface protein
MLRQDAEPEWVCEDPAAHDGSNHRQRHSHPSEWEQHQNCAFIFNDTSLYPSPFLPLPVSTMDPFSGTGSLRCNRSNDALPGFPFYRSQTDSLRKYVEKKIGKVVKKHSAYCSKVDVHLTVQTSVPAGQAEAEVVIFYKKNVFRRCVRSNDMYASIDEVEDKLNRTLQRFKERHEGKSQKSGSVSDLSSVFVDVSEDGSDSGMDDTFAASAGEPAHIPKVEGLVKRKTFPMPVQTIEEAIFCLDYIDHRYATLISAIVCVRCRSATYLTLPLLRLCIALLHCNAQLLHVSLEGYRESKPCVSP